MIPVHDSLLIVPDDALDKAELELGNESVINDSVCVSLG
jgi:hypothetical protein